MNNTSIILLLTCSIIVGISMVSQAGVNAQLRIALQTPVQAAFISFLTGTIILGAVALIQGHNWFTRESFVSIPWWAWLGGLLGAFNIAMSIWLAPKLGALALAVAIVCGQVIASLIYDQNGWLGYPKIELSAQRILGAVLIVAGVFLVAKK